VGIKFLRLSDRDLHVEWGRRDRGTGISRGDGNKYHGSPVIAGMDGNGIDFCVNT